MVLTLAVAVSACSSGQDGSVTRLASEPALTGGTYSTGGGLTVASVLRNEGGRVALCGVWSESVSQTVYSKGKAKDVLASGAAYLGGQRITTGLDYFRQVPAGTTYSGGDASCRTSGIAWSERYEGVQPNIVLPRQTVYRDRDTPGGLTVRFTQTGPGALSGSLDLVETLFRQPVRIDLGPNPATGAGQYSTGGEIRAAVELRQIGKAAYVCGVWAETRGRSIQTEKQAPEVLARGAVSVGGEMLVEDLRFLRRVSAKRPLSNATAHCIDSGQAWADLKAGAPVRVRLPKMIVYSGPGETITFSPTGSNT